MPPYLDLPRHGPSRLTTLCPPALLDSCGGLACALDADGTVRAVGAAWNSVAQRTARPDLTPERVSGQSFTELLPSGDFRDEVKELFQRGDGSPADVHSLSATVDLGVPQKPCLLSLTISPIKSGERLNGFIVHGIDVTQEHVTRQALLDRERKLREWRSENDALRQEIAAETHRGEILREEHANASIELLHCYRADPKELAAHVCRILCTAGGALYACAAKYFDEEKVFRMIAQHNSPDFYRECIATGFLEVAMGEAPMGMAGALRSPMKFADLLNREDYVPWAHLAREFGYNTAWVFPLCDEAGVWGGVQLYFREDDHDLSRDRIELLTHLCRLATPLLWMAHDAEREPSSRPSESAPPGVTAPQDGYGFRLAAASLAEEFSNLLTGVLGHSSLAAAEIGDRHRAAEDIRAIEKSARHAARLTRRLLALSGAARRASSTIDLKAFMRRYVQEADGEFTGGVEESAAFGGSCGVGVDASSLELIFEAMADHARAALSGGGVPQWRCESGETTAVVTLSYAGDARIPRSWDHAEPVHPARNPLPEICFAREVARALGGDLEIEAGPNAVAMILRLPRATVGKELLQEGAGKT